jgi:hypothetical protein
MAPCLRALFPKGSNGSRIVGVVEDLIRSSISHFASSPIALFRVFFHVTLFNGVTDIVDDHRIV